MSRGASRLGAAALPLWMLLFKAACAETPDLADAGLSTAAPPAPPYVDRVLDEGPQAASSFRDPGAGASSTGMPRGVQIDYGLTSGTFLRPGQQRSLSLQGFVEPDGWGSLSFACTGGQFQGQRAGARCLSRRLDWRALPLSGGWIADVSAGHHTSPANPLATGLSRALTPALALDGVSARWRLDERAEVNASMGAPGRLGYPGFDSLTEPGTRIATAGGRVRLADPAASGSRIEVALQALTTTVAARQPAGSPGLDRSARALWSSIAWERRPMREGAGPHWDPMADPTQMKPGGFRVQANWLHSALQDGRVAHGTWLEAGARAGAWAHAGGLFSFGPGLAWGSGRVADDLQGAYWRGSTQAARWSLGWSTELSRRPQADAAVSTFASAFAQYQVDTRTVTGSTLSLRRGRFPAEGAQWRWDTTTSWGTSSVRVDALRTGASRVVAAGLDQSLAQWSTGAFAASLGWQSQTTPRLADRTVNWGVMVSESPSAATSVDLFLRGTQGPQSRSLSADLVGQWRLSTDWSVFLRYADVRSQSAPAARLESALDSTLIALENTRSTTRFAQLLLRYQARAGTATVPLGGRAGDGAGEITGVVYQDRNGNDQRDPSEPGVAEVTVVLDGRYVTRTDMQGRYAFAPVAAGRHTLMMQLESVPLPWVPSIQTAQTVWVDVRQTRRLDLGLQAIR